MESVLERRIRLYVEKRGGLCVKLQNMTRMGFPDRTILFPGGTCMFMEVKAPAGVEARHQRLWRHALLNLGFPCLTVSSFTDAKEFIDAHVKTA